MGVTGDVMAAGGKWRAISAAEGILNEEDLFELRCRIRNAEFQEIATEILAECEQRLDEAERQKLQKLVEDKPRFGHWTLSDGEYDREYALAMELGRLQVLKGNTSADRDQYQLARSLSRGRPDLVGVNLFDHRRQFRVFLSHRALAMRRFALVETARQRKPRGTIHFD